MTALPYGTDQLIDATMARKRSRMNGLPDYQIDGCCQTPAQLRTVLAITVRFGVLGIQLEIKADIPALFLIG